MPAGNVYTNPPPPFHYGGSRASFFFFFFPPFFSFLPHLSRSPPLFFLIKYRFVCLFFASDECNFLFCTCRVFFQGKPPTKCSLLLQNECSILCILPYSVFIYCNRVFFLRTKSLFFHSPGQAKPPLIYVVIYIRSIELKVYDFVLFFSQSRLRLI